MNNPYSIIQAFLTLLHSVLKDLELSPYCTAALGNEKHWCVQDLVRPDLKPFSPVAAKLPPGHQISKQESHNIPMSSMKTSNNCTKRLGTAKKTFPKYSSNIEVFMIPALE